MSLLRVNLLNDFTHHGEAGERTFTAGIRSMPQDAAAAAKTAGLLGDLPKGERGSRPAAPVASPRPARKRVKARA